MGQTLGCFHEDVKRNPDQQQGIHKRREHSRAMVAEGLGGTRRTALQERCSERQQDCQKIGNVMASLGKQGQTVRPHPHHDQQDNVSEGQQQRSSKYADGSAVIVRMSRHS